MSSRFFYLLNSMIYDLKRSLDLREGFTKKVAVLFNFVQMKGGEGPAQIFCHFFISAFLVNKRSLFLPKWMGMSAEVSGSIREYI